MTDDEELGRRWLARNLSCSDPVLDRLAYFAAGVREENLQQNLIAASSMSALWWRHIVDSAQLLLLARAMLAEDGLWLDLGTGAGFPGLIVGILDCQREVFLVEERRRRVEWLQRCVRELALTNVSVVGSPVTKVERVPASIVSARAFAPLAKLLALSHRFSTSKTIWLLPKGERARQEVEELPGEVRAMFHVKQSVTSATAGIVVGRGVPTLDRRGGGTC